MAAVLDETPRSADEIQTLCGLNRQVVRMLLIRASADGVVRESIRIGRIGRPYHRQSVYARQFIGSEAAAEEAGTPSPVR